MCEILIIFFVDFGQANHHSNHPKVILDSKNLILFKLWIKPNAVQAAEEIKQVTLPQQRKERQVRYVESRRLEN